ncbi:MAG: GTPase domain-containing protein [Deltaproteobacteria bacterium]
MIAKIVYYGPGRCGKTTNLQQVHARMRPETRSELLSVATETDRTIYFDLLPLNLGTISGMKFMVRLFTVPGQVYYAETRKLVLKGADGIVFVADSQDHMVDENRQSLADLKTNLAANGLDYSSIPLVMQWNKRDLPHLIPEAELAAQLNERGVKSLPAVASQGTGVLETLRHITLGVFNHIKAGGKVIPNTAGKKPASSPAAAPAANHPASARVAAAQRPASVKPGSWSASIPKTSLGTNANARQPAAQPAPPREGPGPMKISQDMVLDEFKSLAVMHSQLAERLAAVENEMTRLGRENQEIKEILARQSRA